MWVFVLFDLPVKTKKQRKIAARFRKGLLESGFWMLQFSVYARPCPTEENAQTHGARVRAMLPEMGHVRVIRLTDQQFARMDVFVGCKRSEVEGMPQQLEIF